MNTAEKWHGTTIVLLRKNNETIVIGDGQVSLGNTVLKSKAKKVRKIEKRNVIAGFAGSTADALTLFERLEAKLEKHAGNLSRAAVELAKDLSKRGVFLGMVDTLEYLVRGGRIGKAQGFVGSILRVKPILTIHEGEAHPLERARSRTKGIARLKSLVQEHAPLEKLAVLYTTDLSDAQAIAKEVSKFDPDGDTIVAQLGPVVGNYVGPGTLVLAMIKAKPS